MAKYRVREVKKNGVSRFYPQTKIWGVWLSFTKKGGSGMGRAEDIWFLSKKRAWDAIETYKRQTSPKEVTYHYE